MPDPQLTSSLSLTVKGFGSPRRRKSLEFSRKKTIASAKKEGEEGDAPAEEAKKSNHVLRKLEKLQHDHKLDPHIGEQFGSGDY